MTKLTLRTGAAVAVLAALSACSGSSDGGSTGNGDSTGGGNGGTPTAPAISFDDVSAARTAIQTLDDATGTPSGLFTSVTQTGAVSYTGSIVTDLALTGEDSVDGLIGDMAISVAFDSSNDITGSISNLHTLDGSVPQERLSGSLSVDGQNSPSSREMQATASGTLTGFVGQDSSGSLEVEMDLAGDYTYTIVQTPSTTPFVLPGLYEDATGYVGTATGTITGHVSGDIEGDWGVEESDGQ